MDCFINSGIFLRANGSANCGCHTGAGVVLQRFDPAIDYGEDVFLGGRYQEIRDALRDGRLPFDACAACSLLHTTREFRPEYATDRVIEVIHLEPSYACSLECPSCVKIRDRKGNLEKSEAGHLVLDPAALTKVLDDLTRGGFRVNTFVLEGHGEPLLNRKVWGMIADIKRHFPAAIARVISSCNGARFTPEMLESGIDELVCSIDGVDQESYSPYRIHGSFPDAFAFMSGFARGAAAAGAPIRVVWKYIVFSHNDTDAHLLRAQHMAREAGVDQLVFVITRLGPYSRRIYEPDDIPRLDGGVPVSVETNVPTLREFDQRLRECGMWYLGEAPRPDLEDEACSLIAAWVEADARRRAQQYRVFRDLLDEAAMVDRHAGARLQVLHQRLLDRGVFDGVASGEARAAEGA